MLPCATIEGRLPSHMFGELPDDEEQEVLNHLESCPACQRVFVALQETFVDFQPQTGEVGLGDERIAEIMALAEEMDTARAARPPIMQFLIPAIAAIAVFCVTGWWFMNQQQDDRTRAVVHTDTTAAPQANESRELKVGAAASALETMGIEEQTDMKEMPATTAKATRKDLEMLDDLQEQVVSTVDTPGKPKPYAEPAPVIVIPELNAPLLTPALPKLPAPGAPTPSPAPPAPMATPMPMAPMEADLADAVQLAQPLEDAAAELPAVADPEAEAGRKAEEAMMLAKKRMDKATEGISSMAGRAQKTGERATARGAVPPKVLNYALSLDREEIARGIDLTVQVVPSPINRQRQVLAITLATGTKTRPVAARIRLNDKVVATGSILGAPQAVTGQPAASLLLAELDLGGKTPPDLGSLELLDAADRVINSIPLVDDGQLYVARTDTTLQVAIAKAYAVTMEALRQERTKAAAAEAAMPADEAEADD